MKLRKGDQVKITAGKDKGKTGKVEKVLSNEEKVLITGMNMFKRHMKARDAQRPAGIIDIMKPLSLGSIALVCPKCKQQTRVGFIFEGTEKVRICRKCKQSLR